MAISTPLAPSKPIRRSGVDCPVAPKARRYRARREEDVHEISMQGLYLEDDIRRQSLEQQFSQVAASHGLDGLDEGDRPEQFQSRQQHEHQMLQFRWQAFESQLRLRGRVRGTKACPVLGVDYDAPMEEIKRAHQAKQLQYPLEQNLNDPWVNQHRQLVKDAFDCLEAYQRSLAV